MANLKPIDNVEQYTADFDPNDERDKAAMLALWALYARAKAVPTAVWDSDSETMRYPNGQAVPEAVVRRNMNAVASRASRDMGDTTRRLQQGDVSLQYWHDDGADKLRRLYWLAAVMAFGGVGRGVPAQERYLVVPLIAQQLRFWSGLAQEIATSEEVLRSRAFARGIMYGRGGSAVYQNARRAFHGRVLRYDQERRILGIVEKHCPDCPSIAQRGWVALGTLPAIGDSACRSNCACYFEFRRLSNV